MATGWPLSRPVIALELAAEASRAAGVASITKLLLGDDTGTSKDTADMRGLELPRVMGISVLTGDPMELEQLRDGEATAPAAGGEGGGVVVPVPIIPEECR
jgi:hypothetical protein